MERLYDEITIRIRPLDGTIRVEEHTGNLVEVKNISSNDLLACLEKGIKESKTIQTGFLPENCISLEMRDWQKTVTLWLPPGYIDFTYHKTVYEHFPLPALAFSLTVDTKGRTYSHRMAIIDNEAPSPKTRLYMYPFSNMYEDTRICIGAANSLPEYKNLRTLGSLPYLILSLPNNDHEFRRSNNRQKLQYRELLELLKDKEPSYYYEHILIPSRFSLQDFIDNRVRMGENRNAA